MALLAACSEGAAPVQGGTAVLLENAVPRTANPLVANDVYSEELTRSLLYLSLLERDEALALAPRLAESWETRGDTAARFILRRDVHWSDGRPVTAHDVAFTYALARDSSVSYSDRATLDHLLEVVATDSFTVDWRFRPVRDPLAAATLPVLPAHILDSIPSGGLATTAFNLSPVTSGPFEVTEARPGDRWVLARRADFPESLGGPPLLDRLVWREVSETAAQLAEIRAGEADIVVGMRPEAAAQLDTARVRLIQRPLPRYTTVAWNARRPPLDDARVRRALGLAMDRRGIITGLRAGQGMPAAGPVPPGHSAHAADVLPLPHDPAAARALLDSAGISDSDGDRIREWGDDAPFDLTLLYPAGSDFNRDLAQVLQAQLLEIGVALEPRAVEFSSLVGIITAADRDFDAVLLALDTDPRIDLRSLFHSDAASGPFQLAGFSLPALDAVLDSLEAAPDGTDALPLWRRAQQLIAEHQPWAFLYHATETVAVRRALHGVRADLRGALRSAPEWWLEPSEDGGESGGRQGGG